MVSAVDGGRQGGRHAGSQRSQADRRRFGGIPAGSQRRPHGASRSAHRTSSAGSRSRRRMRDVSPDLMDILGTASSLPIGTEGAADDGAAEYVYRFAPLVGIYGGTLEVFRNMIAQYVLGLGKPNYSPPAAKKASLTRMRDRVVQWTTGNVGKQSVQGHRRPPRPRARRLLRVVVGQGRPRRRRAVRPRADRRRPPPTTSTRCSH